jgi:hypothetical protein
LSGQTTNWVDTNVVVGQAYEYQFYKSTSNHVGYGYICAGIDLPLIENRGEIILLVDQSFAGTLSAELATLQQDLVGDGWTVLRHDVPRDASVRQVKAMIRSDYDSDPVNVKALFLLGRVPVPYSGDSAPDGHPIEHNGAWPADTFYGDMDGVWTDDEVNDITSVDPRNYNVPGDGKYDQSEIPGRVALEIGRVDFAHMPGVDTNGISTFPVEGELLRRYLNKDHNYRQKHMSLPARGLVFNWTGDRGGEAFAADAWRNYAPLLGPGAVQAVGGDLFLPVLHTQGYQWAYATSGAGVSEMWFLGGTLLMYGIDWGSSVDFVQMDIQTHFVMLLGSWIGDWDETDNLMRAVLATPTYGLACVYAGRPHWFFHYMGIGETLGYCARLTQNNHAGGLYRNQTNNFAGYVHIELLGDPTLRLQVVAPPSRLRAVSTGSGIQLSWSASADEVAGYHVYRATNPAGPFIRLTPSLIPITSFPDSTQAPGGSTYMVRAVKLQGSPSGSYFNASQGAFTTVGDLFLARLSMTASNLTFTWPSMPGRVYTVLRSDSLTGTNWVPVSDDLLATSASITWASSMSGVVSGSGWVSTNVTHPAGNTIIWVEDALPAGGQPPWDSDRWNWVSSNPAPFSGALAWQSAPGTALHQQYFTAATATMSVNSNDVLVAYVYLDPTNPPTEVMLQWNDGASWEHRAFWGADRIFYGEYGTPGHVSMGDLPPTGRWVALQVPAALLALVGKTVSGMAFSEFDGRATWDYAGKYATTPASRSTGTGVSSILTPGQCFFKVLLLP